MNEQSNPQFNEPTQNSKAILAIVISIIVTALIVGGGVYAWQKSNLKLAEQSLQQQITNLKNQISQLQQTQLTQNLSNNDNTLATYQNQQYGFEFQYPKDWPEPTMASGFLSGGYPSEKSKWVLHVGDFGRGQCEGVDCAPYELAGFSVLNYNSALVSLQKNNFISGIKETNINGLKVISYIESGMRADQVALIFGSTQTLKLVNVWGEKKYFDQIISTLKLAESQDVVYTNSTYGFTLNFPQSWKGFIAKDRTADWGENGTVKIVDFGFSSPSAAFFISVHSKSQWQKIKAESELITPIYLGENSQYVFGYTPAQDGPNDATTSARMAAIEGIVKTFKITQ